MGTYSKISREGSGVAQSVERLAVNQVVAGSSPAAGAIFYFKSSRKLINAMIFWTLRLLLSLFPSIVYPACCNRGEAAFYKASLPSVIVATQVTKSSIKRACLL